MNFENYEENGYDHDSNLLILCVFHVLQWEVSAKLTMSIEGLLTSVQGVFWA